MNVAMPGREQAVTRTRDVLWSCFQTSLASLSKEKHKQSQLQEKTQTVTTTVDFSRQLLTRCLSRDYLNDSRHEHECEGVPRCILGFYHPL